MRRGNGAVAYEVGKGFWEKDGEDQEDGRVDY